MVISNQAGILLHIFHQNSRFCQLSISNSVSVDKVGSDTVGI